MQATSKKICSKKCLPNLNVVSIFQKFENVKDLMSEYYTHALHRFAHASGRFHQALANAEESLSPLACRFILIRFFCLGYHQAYWWLDFHLFIMFTSISQP